MYEIKIALMEFINARPEGNVLREIAERTLHDLRLYEQTRVYSYINQVQYKIRQEKISKGHLKKEIQIVGRDRTNEMASKNLKRIRIRENITQEKFAALFHYSESSYNTYEVGKNMVPIDLIVSVCLTYQIPMEKFITQLV